MQAIHDRDPFRRRTLKVSGASRAKSNSLFVAALAASLLGLTLLDVVPLEAAQRGEPAAVDSTDCIVATAIFAGVTPMP